MPKDNIIISILRETYIYLRARSAAERKTMQELLEHSLIQFRLEHPELEPPAELVTAVRTQLQYPLPRGRRTASGVGANRTVREVEHD